MKVLFVSSEVSPFSKTGGLADVSGALPAALAALGHEVTVVTPLYASARAPTLVDLGQSIVQRYPFGPLTAALRGLRLAPNLEVVFLDQPQLYGRAGLYFQDGQDYGDNHRRFAFLGTGALAAAQTLGLDPDIVHLNDWQTGLAAVALARAFRKTRLGRARCVFTIHNLAYQGMFPKRVMGDLGLPWDLFTLDQLEFYDQVSFLKAGLAYADALTTVSRTYAQEIQTWEGGHGLDGFLRDRAARLVGIVNGVDVVEWNPASDPYLPARFTAADLRGKEVCKRALLARFGLAGREGLPVFGMVGRLTDQKGIELLLAALPQLLDLPLSLVLVGSGTPAYEQALREVAAAHADRCSVHFGFDPALAHLVEAGSDFFLMPSLYEPCGLNQMYSLRYGTVPVVRATGGLEDTVVDLDLPDGTGVKFGPFEVPALLSAIARALELYAEAPRLEDVRRRGMGCDVSWERSARAYAALYADLTSRPGR